MPPRTAKQIHLNQSFCALLRVLCALAVNLPGFPMAFFRPTFSFRPTEHAMHQEIRNTIAWLLSATFVIVTAIWQAQVAARRDLEARRQTLPPPSKTKRTDRSDGGPRSSDPVADYLARCQKGLTDQEIAWIASDFQNTGLDHPPGAATAQDYLSYRRAQHRWYCGALADALHLTPGQAAQAAAKLAGFYQTAAQSYLAMLNSLKPITGPDGKQYLIAGADTFNSVISARDWIERADGAFAPWNLCALTPEQEKLTWQELWSRQHDPSGGSPISPSRPTSDGRVSFLSPTTTTSDRKLPAEFGLANAVFPFLSSQEFIVPGDSFAETDHLLIANVRVLHPAQLKMVLLFNPKMTGKIQTALASGSF